MTRPQNNEAAEYYFNYIDLVTSDDVVAAMKDQLSQTVEFLEGISEEQSLSSYAPGKWTIRELWNHVNDGERLFLSRAFWFARGFTEPMATFDQEIAVAHAHANETSWAKLIEEFKTVRAASLSFLETLPDEAWSRSGVASDNPVTVRALAYIIAGHLAHHVNVLREKYL